MDVNCSHAHKPILNLFCASGRNEKGRHSNRSKRGRGLQAARNWGQANSQEGPRGEQCEDLRRRQRRKGGTRTKEGRGTGAWTGLR
eukprot:1139183-Pelagomonas_calceolata.AAC.2